MKNHTWTIINNSIQQKPTNMTESPTSFFVRLLEITKECILWTLFFYVASVTMTLFGMTAISHFNKTTIEASIRSTKNEQTLTIQDTDLSSSHIDIIFRRTTDKRAQHTTGYGYSIKMIGDVTWSIECNEQKLSGSIKKPVILFFHNHKYGFIRLFDTTPHLTGCSGTVRLFDTTIPSGSAFALRKIEDLKLSFDYTERSDQISGGLLQIFILLTAISISWGGGIPFALLSLAVLASMWERLRHLINKQRNNSRKDK